jgi:hypothetical protein
VKLLCFSEPDIGGNFFNEAGVRDAIQVGPNIQNAFEELDRNLNEARESIRARLEKAARN